MKRIARGTAAPTDGGGTSGFALILNSRPD